MRTCILFFPSTLDLSSCFSVIINSEGALDAPLQKREPSELKAFQKNTYTYLVLPAECATIYHLSLPALSSRKARTAIEFALESRLPLSLEQVHLTYTYEKESQTYEVVVVNKLILRQLIDKLDTLNLRYNGIIIDATLLKPGEAFFDNFRLVINSKSYHGAILSSFEPLYEGCFPDLHCTTNLTLPDSFMEWMKIDKIDYPIQIWLAQRLIKNKLLNLCHGDFSVSASQPPKKGYPWIAGGMCIAWILSYFISAAFEIYQNQHHLDQINSQIETAFKQVFPNAVNTTNPRFRIEQLLKSSQGATSNFWKLLTTLTKQPVEIDTLYYKNKALVLNLKMKQFSDLQALQNKLARSGVKVRQIQAREQGKEINATLELKK